MIEIDAAFSTHTPRTLVENKLGLGSVVVVLEVVVVGATVVVVLDVVVVGATVVVVLEVVVVGATVVVVEDVVVVGVGRGGRRYRRRADIGVADFLAVEGRRDDVARRLEADRDMVRPRLDEHLSGDRRGVTDAEILDEAGTVGMVRAEDRRGRCRHHQGLSGEGGEDRDDRLDDLFLSPRLRYRFRKGG